MYLNGTDPSNPIFLVDANGNYLVDEDGTYVLFAGEAHVEPNGSALMSATGYFLVDTHGNYLSTPESATEADTSDDTATSAGHSSESTPSAGAETAILTDAAARTAVHSAPHASLPAVGQAMPASIPPASRRRLALPNTDLRSDQEKKSDRRNTAIVVLALLLLLALIGVGALWLKNSLFSANDTELYDQPTGQVTGAPTQAADPIQNAGEMPTPTESPSTDDPIQVPVPQGVYPGAGQNAAPADATRIDNNGETVYIASPSGNITCAFGGGISECRVASWAETVPYGRSGGEGEEFPNAKVSFAQDGTSNVGPVSDAMPQGTPLAYGTSTVIENWACGSAQNGLTCWNITTGHGIIINREGYQSF